MHTILAFSAAALMAVGHGSSAKPFDSFANSAFAQMNARQAQLIREYNLTSYPQFHWSQKDGQLLFTDKGRVKVVANVQFVGDVSKHRHTWLWAWANRSALPPMKTAVVRVRRYGEKHAYPKLTTAEWKATPLDGWKMAAVAENLLHAKGVYRSEDATGYTYLVITSIRWADGTTASAHPNYSHPKILAPRSASRKPRVKLAGYAAHTFVHGKPHPMLHHGKPAAHTRKAARHAKRLSIHHA